eukprot:CAMPEP_0117662456 /NCGR_PEP_ID=MMETSP0804-20121206/8062_1 /TAXON_ID=1074897 /ORGANISM="Tetraselmis astigmatica, Strain CCMP880" /LENGTH=99 /DNA_ID=CAMNT_0005469355 /DNA_START=332 /DNA_END=631 /DNA_ORIENTATION=-
MPNQTDETSGPPPLGAAPPAKRPKCDGEGDTNADDLKTRPPWSKSEEIAAFRAAYHELSGLSAVGEGQRAMGVTMGRRRSHFCSTFHRVRATKASRVWA